MGFIQSHVLHVFITVIFLLFCDELSYKVEGDTIIKVANVGDNITLTCNPERRSYDYDVFWYRNNTWIDSKDRSDYKLPRITDYFKEFYTYSHSLYNLSISDVIISDSGIYKCYDKGYEKVVQLFDVRIVKCSCLVTFLDDPNSEKILCSLNNYLTEENLQINITVNGNTYTTSIIVENTFSFGIPVETLQNNFHFELNPYNDVSSRVRCMVPAQFISPNPSTRYTSTSLIPTTSRTLNNRSTASQIHSQELASSTPIPTTQYLPSQKINSGLDNTTGSGNTTLIVVIIGSLCILILIVIIVFLRYKHTKSRQKNKHNGNASTKKEHPPEACYESVEDGSRTGREYAQSTEKVRKSSKDQENVDDKDNDGLVDNILYDSSDRITENSISRVEGPLDNALYAMPDKRATINRESTSKVVDGSSNSDVLYGNSDIISQHEQSKDTLQRGDQYENVEMPGSGSDAEEIQLYAMPDKGPKQNTLKTTPKPEKTSTLSRNEVVDADALYAEVDKPKKK